MRRPEDFSSLSLSPWSRSPPQPRQYIPPSNPVTALATSNKLNDILITNQKATSNCVGENAVATDRNILDGASSSGAEGCEPDDIVDSILGRSNECFDDAAIDCHAFGVLHLVEVHFAPVTPSHGPDYVPRCVDRAVRIRKCAVLDGLAHLEERCLCEHGSWNHDFVTESLPCLLVQRNWLLVLRTGKINFFLDR